MGRLPRGMAATAPKHDVKDLALAAAGVARIRWADRQMPVLAAIRERFEREQRRSKPAVATDAWADPSAPTSEMCRA